MVFITNKFMVIYYKYKIIPMKKYPIKIKTVQIKIIDKQIR
jgi:hypothetical protein